MAVLPQENRQGNTIPRFPIPFELSLSLFSSALVSQYLAPNYDLLNYYVRKELPNLENGDAFGNFVQMAIAFDLAFPIVRFHEWMENGRNKAWIDTWPNGLAKLQAAKYFALDFGDFLEYATSPLTSLSHSPTLDDGLYLYQGILAGSGNPNLQILLGTEDKKFDILGAAVVKRKNCFCVYAAVPLPEDRAKVFYLFLGLRAQGTNPERYVEFNRAVALPYFEGEKVRYALLDSARNEALLSTLEQSETRDEENLKLFHDKQLLLESWKPWFEICRLLMFLPQYFGFMYDLVLPEKIEVGTRQVERKEKRQKGKNRKVTRITEPIYQLVRSIRVSYEVDAEMRSASPSYERMWTAPSYRYEVHGHYRQFTNPEWKGRDAEGNSIFGKTWVSAYFKGQGEGHNETLVLERQPQVTIKLKETLANARDVISAHEQNHESESQIKVVEPSKPKKTVPVPSGEIPTRDWQYAERKKMTSFVRFTILKRDGYRCCICGADGTAPNIRLEVDHKTPISKWGRTEAGNLWTLCHTCNRGKSDRST